MKHFQFFCKRRLIERERERERERISLCKSDFITFFSQLLKWHLFFLCFFFFWMKLKWHLIVVYNTKWYQWYVYVKVILYKSQLTLAFVKKISLTLNAANNKVKKKKKLSFTWPKFRQWLWSSAILISCYFLLEVQVRELDQQCSTKTIKSTQWMPRMCLKNIILPSIFIP